MAAYRLKAASDTPDRKSHFLLVVDSDPENLTYISTLLKRFGYQTFTARTAEEALAIAVVKVPSLVITNMTLKDMGGLELMEQLRKTPKTAGVPFIALTREGDELGEEHSFEAGAVDCLFLPVAAEHLYRSVQTVVEATPRMNIRIRTIQPVKVENMPLDEREGAYTLELSEHGMFLRTREPAALNTRLLLQIDLEGKTIPVEAAVLYRYRAGTGPYLEPGMGLGFVRIKPTDKEIIRRFIQSAVMRGIALGSA